MSYIVEKPNVTTCFFFECHPQSAEAAGVSMTGAHVHDWVEIIYCHSGNMAVILDGKDYIFRTHDLLVVPSHEVHEIMTLTDELHSYTVLKFRPELMSTSMQIPSEYHCILPFLVRGDDHQKLFEAEEIEHSGIPQLITHFTSEYEQMAYGYEIALKADLYNIVLWILRRWYEKDTAEKKIPSPEQMERLQLVLNYVLENYRQSITTADAAAVCHVSYGHFSKLFAKTMGKSFNEYLAAVRLSAAERLLITTEKSVTEIALETGFSSQSYFTQRFTAKNDLTPRDYRKKYRRNG